MDETTAARLIQINRNFYGQFGEAFSATRQRLQDGVRRVLASLPDEGSWLDMGCGNGSLALEWLSRGRHSDYLGLDFSEELLAVAKKAVGSLPSESEGAPVARIRFEQADLSAAAWANSMALGSLRGALAFAVLHHIPSAELRVRILLKLRERLVPGGWFVHSEWQFQHSPKLLARRQPWSRVGLKDGELESGDTLLDWRFALPDQAEQTGLRYVHLFTREELSDLAAACRFEILDEFVSDGHGGQSGLYQIWQRG